jgi:predicted nucleic acid-binding protein
VSLYRIYIETTVWSFAFATDSPDYSAATLAFFDRCRRRSFVTVISGAVIREIARAAQPVRDQLADLVREISPEIVPAQTAIDDLQSNFLRLGVVPPGKPDDAAHVDAAFAAGCDILVSWNFKHITNVRRAERFNAAAAMFGYSKPLRIVTPSEVLYADEE